MKRSLTVVELGADSCTLVRTAVRSNDVQVLAAETVDPRGFPGIEAFTLAVKQSRHGLKLPRRCRAVVWGLPDGASRKDPAVVPLIEPLIKAGFRLERVVTPCNALGALARLRVSRSGGAMCWLAINRGGVAIVVVRPGKMLYSHSFAWDSSMGSSGSQARLLQRYSLVAFLAPEVRRALAAAREKGTTVDGVVTCGNLPDLRSLTMPLIEELDIEVETLDSLEGLVVKPQIADKLLESAPALRLACAAALARGTRSVDERKRRSSRRAGQLRLVLVTAAAATAVAAIAWVWRANIPVGTVRPAPAKASAGKAAITPAAAKTNAPTSPPNKPATAAVTAKSAAPITPTPTPAATKTVPPPPANANVTRTSNPSLPAAPPSTAAQGRFENRPTATQTPPATQMASPPVATKSSPPPIGPSSAALQGRFENHPTAAQTPPATKNASPPVATKSTPPPAALSSTAAQGRFENRPTAAQTPPPTKPVAPIAMNTNPTPVAKANPPAVAKTTPPPATGVQGRLESRAQPPAPVLPMPPALRVNAPPPAPHSTAPAQAAFPGVQGRLESRPTPPPAVSDGAKRSESKSMPALLKDPVPKVTAILVSADRKLATIGEDGQIISVGDVLGRRVVVGIEERAVVLKEPSGVQIRVALGGRVIGVERSERQ